jgi:5,10-methylenetetrahydromethanopterin reductase
MAALPIGLELAGEPSVLEMMTIARRAEALGYESVWLTETRFTRDAITTAAAVAAVTERMRIATAVINPYTRGAALTAVTTATLDELAGGRFILGIGPGSPTVLARQGIAFARPLPRLRETVDVVRRMLRGETVQIGGELDAGRGAALDFTPVRPAVPIYLGVTGPKALALAGEIADGVMLNGFVSAEYTERAVEIVRAAAETAGRGPESVEIAASIVTSIAADGARARDAIRPLIATYLANFPHIARESGVSTDLLERIGSVYRDRDPAAAASLVDDEIVDRLTCCGTIAEVRAGLARRRQAGVHLPIVGFAQSQMTEYLEDLISDSSAAHG